MEHFKMTIKISVIFARSRPVGSERLSGICLKDELYGLVLIMGQLGQHSDKAPFHMIKRTWIIWSRKAVSLLNKRFETISASYKDFNCISSKSEIALTKW